jgi:hypothetical protein
MKKLLFLIALAGCGGLPTRGEPLLDSVTLYNEGVRWERLTHAAARVPPAEREHFLDEREELAEDLKISEWEVERVGEKGARASVRVKYVWYLDTEGTVHTTHTDQAWERHGKAWLLVDERRTRGEPMPGVREPSDEVAEGEPR